MMTLFVMALLMGGVQQQETLTTIDHKVVAATGQEIIHIRGVGWVNPGIRTDAPPATADQALHSTVKDPKHPDEPWEVWTYRRGGESHSAMIARHAKLLRAVRDELQGDDE